jgi:hypothetical protein
MLNYTDTHRPALILAEHYSSKIQAPVFTSFMQGRADLESSEDAVDVINHFWEMTELAIADHEAGRDIQGVTDIEHWMHRLFQKVSGYMIQHGFGELWQESIDKQ